MRKDEVGVNLQLLNKFSNLAKLSARTHKAENCIPEANTSPFCVFYLFFPKCIQIF